MLQIDADFPGGNIVVDSIDGNTVYLQQDLRDTTTFWFYWYFRLRGGAGRRLTFHFTNGKVLGVRGPAFSLDEGRTWSWLGTETVQENRFDYMVPENVQEVRFSMGMPYLEADLHAFLERHHDRPALELGTLCRTEKGRRAEKLRLGRLDGRASHRVLLTCRHHCCEMMASYALEGIMETILQDPDDGAWLRANAEFLVIPFVDKDGVEQGDQGKNRRPHDHNRDYNDTSLFATVQALRDTVPAWGGDRLRMALDLHCPYIRGKHDHFIYFPGNEYPAIWKRTVDFAGILEDGSRGPLPYRAADNLPYGEGWNTAANFSQGRSFNSWACELPGILIAAAMEIPYADVHGQEVNAASARAFGHDLARAIRKWLEQTALESVRGPNGNSKDPTNLKEKTS